MPNAFELAQAIDAFLERSARNRRVWTVSGVGGFARVPSATVKGRAAVLLWTDKAEALKWADALVRAPRLVAIPLDQLLAETLPAFAEAGQLIAPDWSVDPLEPELEATDAADRLRRHLLGGFVSEAAAQKAVWILREGPSIGLLDVPGSTRKVLPVWSNRRDTQYGLDPLGGWPALMTATPARVTLSDFAWRVLIPCAEQRISVAPAFIAGASITIMPPWELKKLLTGALSDGRQVA